MWGLWILQTKLSLSNFLKLNFKPLKRRQREMFKILKKKTKRRKIKSLLDYIKICSSLFLSLIHAGKPSPKTNSAAAVSISDRYGGWSALADSEATPMWQSIMIRNLPARIIFIWNLSRGTVFRAGVISNKGVNNNGFFIVRYTLVDKIKEPKTFPGAVSNLC